MISRPSTILNRLRSRSSLFLTLTIFAIFLFGLTTPEARSQTQSWKVGTSGTYTDPTQWDSNDVPDSLSETAEFDVFGIYTVNISQSIGGTIDQLAITRGDIRFFSSTFGDETLTTQNGIEITNAEVDLDRKNSFGNVHFASNGSLVISDAAQLSVFKQSSIDVNGIDIAAGGNFQTSEIYLNNDQTSTLGDVVIANRESGSFEGALNVYNNSTAIVDNIDLATTGVTGRRGYLQLVGGATVTQASGITNVGANSTDGEASLFISSSSFAGDVINVYSNGRINLVSGHIGIAGSLTVDGGLYEEANFSTRTLGANTSLTFINQAEGVFTNQDLVLLAGQSLSVQDSTLNGEATLEIQSGNTQLSGNSLVGIPIQVATGGNISITSGDTTLASQVTQVGTFEIASGASATFEENFFGNSILGDGIAIFEDTVKPYEISSPLSIAGDVNLDTTAELEIAIGGTSVTQQDQILVGNSITLGGVIRVSLIDLGTGVFVPSIGDEFQLLSASSILGAFDDVQLPLISSTEQWQLIQTTTEVSLRLVDRGDYNGDGAIDAADYTVWRDSLGNAGQHLAADGNGDGSITQDDYNLWATARSAASSLSHIRSSHPISVPEPASWIFFFSATSFATLGYARAFQI